MNDVEHIERQVRELSPEELAKFRRWFAEFDAEAWDRQIEADLKTGRLDHLISKARADFKAGKAREL